MVETTVVKIDKTKGAIYSRRSNECALETSDEIEQFSGEMWFQIIKCMECETISFRHAILDHQDYDYSPDGDREPGITESLYPDRMVLREGLEFEALYSLPKQLREIYMETLQAINSKMLILAGIGIRALIETVCKDQKAKGRNLEKKIDSLVAMQILTPVRAKALHKLRILGNKSAHSVKPHTREQLNLALDIVEHVLNDAYVLQGQIEERFN